MGILKVIKQGFSGGPDFEHARLNTFIIGDQVLQLSLPATPFQTAEDVVSERYAIEQPGWFEEHAKHKFHHYCVHLVTELWPYGPRIWLPIAADQSFGELTFQARIKKIPEQAEINVRNLIDLGKLEFALREQHYWASEKGKGWRGANTELKQECIEEYPPRGGYSVDFESVDDFVEYTINLHGYPPISPEIVDVAGRQFVFHVEGCGNRQIDRTYSLPLNDEYYLQLRFRHNLEGAPKKVETHALQAERRILTEMSLGPLLEEQPLQIERTG